MMQKVGEVYEMRVGSCRPFVPFNGRSDCRKTLPDVCLGGSTQKCGSESGEMGQRGKHLTGLRGQSRVGGGSA